MNGNLILNNIDFLNRLNNAAKYLIIIFLGSLLFALSARIKIDVPPVPVVVGELDDLFWYCNLEECVLV